MDAIRQEPGNEHLTKDGVALANEWFRRKLEKLTPEQAAALPEDSWEGILWRQFQQSVQEEAREAGAAPLTDEQLHELAVMGAQGTGGRGKVDKMLSAPNLPHEDSSPQHSGSDVALDTFRRSLRAAQGEIERLGAQVEEISSAEALRRGIPSDFTVGVTPDRRRLLVVTDKLAGKPGSWDAATVIVREEVIHLAWLAAMREGHQRSGAWYDFDHWMETEVQGWINELQASEKGAQILVDAANLYDQRPTLYKTVDDALAGFEGRESQLIPELARQLVQLRESGQISESVIARVMNKVREWFTAALERLRATAAEMDQVSPSLDAAIKETERILASVKAASGGPG